MDATTTTETTNNVTTAMISTVPTLRTGTVPPHSLSDVLSHVAAGGVLVVPSYTRWIVIDKKTVAKFEKAGHWLVKEEGNGYRIRQGKGSVYILPGQMQYARYK